MLGQDAASVLLVTAIALLAIAGYAYVGYPMLVRLLPPRRRPPAPTGDFTPSLSVLIAARNEAAHIEARVRNLLDQDYPASQLEVLVVSDASDDGTDAIVRGIGDPRVTLVRQEPRGGKTAGINRLAPLSRGDVLVQTDANVSFAPGALRSLAATFADPRVGLALGEVRFTNDDQAEVAGGEGLYWRFETWTKRLEAERELLCVANGGIYALRRELWRPLPSNIAGDAAEPLLVAKAGFITTITPGATALERAAATLGEEYRRKVRIIAQQVACAKQIGLLSLPPRILFAYVSHKLLRYAVPLFALGAMGLALAAAAIGSSWGLALALAILLPLPLAALAWLRLPGIAGRLASTALYLIALQVASVAGIWRGLTGRAEAAWEIPASTRHADGHPSD